MWEVLLAGMVILVSILVTFKVRQRFEKIKESFNGQYEILGGLKFKVARKGETKESHFFVRSVGGPQGVAGNRRGHTQLLLELEKPWAGFFGRVGSYKYFYLGRPSEKYVETKWADLDFLEKGLKDSFQEFAGSPEGKASLEEIFGKEFMAVVGRSQFEISPKLRRKNYLVLNWVSPESLQKPELMMKRVQWLLEFSQHLGS